MKPLSYPVKVTLISTTVGIALIAVLATFFKRRRGRQPTRKTYNPETFIKSRTNSRSRTSSLRRMRSPSVLKSPNGDIVTAFPTNRATSMGSSVYAFRSGSIAGSNASINTMDSNATVTHPIEDAAVMNPEQLCDFGMDILQNAICQWEDALDKLDVLLTDMPDGAVTYSSLRGQLNHLLDRAYRMQELYESESLKRVSANVAVDSATAVLMELDKAYDAEKRRTRTMSLDEESSDIDSFVSANEEVADLSDLEDRCAKAEDKLALYKCALLELTNGSIPYRSLRTKMVDCSSDTEFLAKLYCIRLALGQVFKDPDVGVWLSNCGKDMISQMLIKGEKIPDDFESSYDKLMVFCRDPENWEKIESELHHRGVKMMTFYDVVIDFVMFDAFDDLENPPSSVTTVIQNRWLSNGFKETALSTAVWSVLKAKRRMLKYPDGFVSHFYGVTEHVSPMFAWGFLGPEGNLKDLCYFFKDQVMGFMRDMFSFRKVRYTTIEHLAEDILKLAKHRIQQTMDGLDEL